MPSGVAPGAAATTGIDTTGAPCAGPMASVAVPLALAPVPSVTV